MLEAEDKNIAQMKSARISNTQVSNTQIDKSQAPIRVLHVFGRVGLGGAESRIMDMYRNMDRSKVQFDFLVHASAKKTGKKCPTSDELMAVREPDYYDDEIRRLGGNIYVVPRFEGKNFIEYKKAIEKLFTDNKGKWVVVHGHMTSTAAIYLPIAKKKGLAKITIAHSRNAGTEPGIKGLATKFFRLPLKKKGTADFYFTCSEIAGRAVFGDRLFDKGYVTTIPNAIDVAKFKYDYAIRDKIRKELGVDEDTVVIGHIGRFDYQKNHEFLIKIFASLLSKTDKKMKLILIGKGDLTEKVRQQVMDLGINDNVMFLGLKSNAADYYRAMDYFLFPSFYEGLPGTVVEAQAACLKCLISDTITQEVHLTDLVSSMSLDKGADEWADKILQDIDAGNDREADTPKYASILREKGFDAKTQSERMSYFYLHGSFKN